MEFVLLLPNVVKKKESSLMASIVHLGHSVQETSQLNSWESRLQWATWYPRPFPKSNKAWASTGVRRGCPMRLSGMCRLEPQQTSDVLQNTAKESHSSPEDEVGDIGAFYGLWSTPKQCKPYLPWIWNRWHQDDCNFDELALNCQCWFQNLVLQEPIVMAENAFKIMKEAQKCYEIMKKARKG